MPKTLLIGPAGSGKTHRALAEFEQFLKNDRAPLKESAFFLVPSAEHTGRIISVLMSRGVEGFFHRRVTTLSRLISGIFGIGTEGIATNTTRYILLREILEKRNWECFKEIRESAGFLNHMLSFISELKEAMIPAPFWREKMNALKAREPDLAAKYEALAGIYEAYEEGLKQKGLRDRQDGFTLFQERKQAGAFRHRRFESLWFDGFFDFSELQLAYFKELCDMSENVTVTLTYEEDPKRAALFDAVRPVFETLTGLGFKAERPDAKSRGRFISPGIAAVEKGLFREGKTDLAPKSPDLTLFEAIGIEGEIEMIARQIERMIRAGNYRFSDFAILFREIGVYDSVVRSVFERYGIPVEVHERERLSFAPMMRVIVRMLRIFRDGWKRTDLMEFLKSAYVAQIGGKARDYEWIGALEHRAMERGVFRGRDQWLEPWTQAPELKVIAEVEDSLRSAKSFPELKNTFLRAVTSTFRIFQKTVSLEDYVRRDAASYRRLESILDETGISFLQGQEISFDAFADRFFRLVELDLYPLHERDRNRVQVYSVSLARQKEYRVVFAAGLLEKKFPVQIKEDPVFSDWERVLFNESRNEKILKEKLPRQSMERYLFYVALTRASETLFLTYPRLDLEGKEALPSYYVEEVKKIFGGNAAVKKQDLGRPYPLLEEAVSERELEMAVLGELWAPEKDAAKRPLVLFLTNELLKRPASRGKMVRAFFEVSDDLGDLAASGQDLFKPYETSPTTLEEYARCAFKYYAHRVLRLNDPEEDVNITRRGSILHKVLQKCFEKWNGHFPPFERACKDAEAELAEAFKRYPLVTEKQYQLDLERESLRDMLFEFLRHELERLKDSPLQPRYFELAFGKEGSKFPVYEIDVNGRKMKIRGEIDRIDTDAAQTVGVILDYKRTASAAKCDPKDFQMGVSLQLPLYLLMMEKYLGLKPAGAELYAVKERKKSGFYHADYTQYFPGLGAKKMIFPEEEFRAFLSRSVDFVRQFNASMAKMEMAVRPRTLKECDFCSYGPVCRIQKWRVPLIVEEIKAELAKAREAVS